MNLDPADDRLDGFRRLNEPRYRRRYEEQHGIFVAEGPTVVERVAKHAPGMVQAILADERRSGRVPSIPDVPVFHGSPRVIESIVGFAFHRGVLAVCRRPPLTTVEHLASLPAIALAEGINDHENLGALIRAAVGLGLHGLVLDPTSADPWYRRSVRVSMGTVVDLPMARAQTWPDPVDVLIRSGMTLVATSPSHGDDVRALGRIERPAIAIGAEGPGLSESVLGRAAVTVRIPMEREVDSLNVGQAAAIVFDRLVSRS